MSISAIVRPLTTFFSSLALLSTLLAGWVAAADITVSAAMSLKGAFEEIGRSYETRHPGSKVHFNFGASGDLARQIAGGAPIDIFAAAAQRDMDDLAARGLIQSATCAVFAGNTLVVLAPKRGGNLKSFPDLRNPSVKRVAVTNPKTSPAGRYASQAFAHYRVAGEVKNKLIYAENVRQVMDYVARGEVDAGVVFGSDAVVRAHEVVVAATAAPESHELILYPIAVTKDSRRAADAVRFIAVVLSDEGQHILKKHGFIRLRQ